jgi:hypothetical protein
MCCEPPKPGLDEPWWSTVRVAKAVVHFGSEQEAENYLAKDFEKLNPFEVELYRKLNWQRDQAAGE